MAYLLSNKNIISNIYILQWECSKKYFHHKILLTVNGKNILSPNFFPVLLSLNIYGV